MNRKYKRWFSRFVALAFVSAVVALIVVASMPKPVAVDAAEVESGVLEVTIDQDGKTRVKDRYTLSAPLSGNLARLELAPGDLVEQGAILARIVPLAPPLMDERTRAQSQARLAQALAAQRQSQATISRAEAAVTYSEGELGRQQQMADRGIATGQTLDLARFEHRSRSEELASARFGARVADHEVQMARAALGRMRNNSGGDQMDVPAPVAGKVLRVMREDEGVVAAGTALLELGDPAALEVVVDVLTADAVRIKPGAHVRLERWGGAGELEGHVRRVEPSAFTKVSSLGVEEQRVNVLIDIDTEREQWEALGDGFRVEARIELERAEDALKVPASALFRHGQSWGVFVIGAESKAELREVEVGLRNGLEAQVLSGLEAGDRVVIHPSDSVVEGVELSIR